MNGSEAERGQARWGRAVEMSAPRHFVVLVQGMEKEAARVLFSGGKIDRGRTERLRRSKEDLGMATAPTVQANGDDGPRDSARTDKASMVTGGRLTRWEDGRMEE
jgi:hypothetical protein